MARVVMVQAERVTSLDEARRKTTRVYWLEIRQRPAAAIDDYAMQFMRRSVASR
jgi:hypothetical protein